MFTLIKHLSVNFDMLALSEMFWECDFVFDRRVNVEFTIQFCSIYAVVLEF